MDETLPASPGRLEPVLGRVIAGRYRLDAYLGRGGSGTVFRSRDQVTDTDVAVKVLRDVEDGGRARVRREIGLLRALRVPGVVHLLDDVVEDETYVLVMEYVDGKPFPGADFDGRWATLEPLAVGLLETLRRVHVRGVVHRDLKPGNVLVDANERVHVLDFGLSVGPTLGGLRVDRGFLYGTPAYLAPEQVRGTAATPETDLYAVGVILYEALAGRLPHTVESVPRLIAAKVSTEPLPLSHFRPDLPTHVIETVTRLLEIRPDDRPGSARRVLRLLRGESRRALIGQPPWLGSRAIVDAVVDEVVQGRSVDIVGARGSGKTRLLTEVRATLEEMGFTVRATRSAEAPFSSLGPMARMEAPEDSGDLAAHVAEHLAGTDDGAPIFADDAESLDRWSARALFLAADKIPVVRTRRSPGRGAAAIRLEPLARDDLEQLFTASSRFGCLSADAADELYRRTAGHPGAIADEIGCWIRAGVAHLDGERVTVFRAALDRFRAGLELAPPVMEAEQAPDAAAELQELLAWMALAWPCTDIEVLSAVIGRPVETLRSQVAQLVEAGVAEWASDRHARPTAVTWSARFADQEQRLAAHSLVARALPPGAHGRLLHLIACDDAADIAEEARVVAVNLRDAGQYGQAVEALAEGVRALRRSGQTAVDPLLREWLLTALVMMHPQPLDRVLHEISRWPSPTEKTVCYDRFARAAQAARAAGGERAIEMLDALGEVDDETLERWRLALRVHCAFALPVEREEELFREFQSWCSGRDGAEIQETLAMLEGRLYYRQGRFEEAARSQERAGEVAPGGPHPSALLNQATAWLEAFDFDAAARAAEAARDAARVGREFMKEAKAEYLLRAASYRRGLPMEPDPELVNAVAEVGVPYMEALISLTEAAVAWRCGDRELVRELAERSGKTWLLVEFPAGVRMSGALHHACAEPTLAELEAAAAEVMTGTDLPRLRVQTLGLLALATPDGVVPPPWLETALALAVDVPDEHHSARLEVMSIAEALDALRGDQALRRRAISA